MLFPVGWCSKQRTKKGEGGKEKENACLCLLWKLLEREMKGVRQQQKSRAGVNKSRAPGGSPVYF